MQFKVYNNLNTSHKTLESHPTVRFATKSGLITLNSVAVELLGIEETKKIELIKTDEDEWYVCSSDSKFAFELRKNTLGSSMFFNNTYLTKLIVAGSKKFFISTNPLEYEEKKYFLILTKKPIGKNNNE